MEKKDIEKFIKVLGIQFPLVSVSFVDQAPQSYAVRQDTACTALARAFLKKQTSYFNRFSQRQLCSGADYFFKLAQINEQEAVENYVKDEHVFAEEAVCRKFLKKMPKIPDRLKIKTVMIKSLTAKDDPEVIALLVTPAQAGRIVGLLNYKTFEEIKLAPNQPTCISLFAPLATGRPHLNLIDYYDRYYQGMVNKKLIWPESHMIVSMASEQFGTILENITKSPHGSFVPKLEPQKVDKF